MKSEISISLVFSFYQLITVNQKSNTFVKLGMRSRLTFTDFMVKLCVINSNLKRSGIACNEY